MMLAFKEPATFFFVLTAIECILLAFDSVIISRCGGFTMMPPAGRCISSGGIRIYGTDWPVLRMDRLNVSPLLKGFLFERETAAFCIRDFPIISDVSPVISLFVRFG